MITIQNLSYRYPTAAAPALDGLSLTIPDAAFVLVTGESGAGKSTLLRALNGLIPHFHGGTFGGSVQIDGCDTLRTPPRLLARAVGFVFQDPESQFVVPTVEDEIAFGLENQGMAPRRMRDQIGWACEALGITHLRRAEVHRLSGGEMQRVAIASALAAGARHLILDEPTSQLDPASAHDLLHRLVELNCAHRLTIVLAEHRLERVLGSATHLLHLSREGALFGTPRDVLPRSPLRPPVVDLALRAGWKPLPLTVEEARAFAGRLPDDVADERAEWANQAAPVALDVRGLASGYPGRSVIREMDWQVRQGEIVGLLGANGAGKSTLLKTIVGLLRPRHGAVYLLGERTDGKALHELARIVGYVPQNPNSVLFAETLADEVQFTLTNHGVHGDSEAVLARFGLIGYAARYPRDLSGGERQRAALAAMLAAGPRIVLLDEPTRGLDYGQKARLADLLRAWAAEGVAVVVATHDVEWIAGLAHRGTLLRDGSITDDGPIREVLRRTPGYRTQLDELHSLVPA